MGYVFPEIILPLIITFLVGLGLGWLLWRWRRTKISWSEWETTRTVLADTKHRLGEVETERDDINGKLSLLGEEHEVVVGERDTAHADVKRLTADLETRTAKVTTLEADVKAATTRADGLQSELDAATERATSLQADLDAATERATSLQADLDATIARADGLQVDLDVAAKRVTSLQGDLDERDVRLSSFASLANDHDAATTRLGQLEADLDVAREQAAAHATALDERDNQINAFATLSTDHEAATTRLAQLETDLTAANERAATLQAELDAANERGAQMEIDLRDTSSAAAAASSEHATELAARDARIGDLEAELTATGETVSTLSLLDPHPYGDGSHLPLRDRSMPAGYPIKGNVDSMLYHRPDSRNYGATIAEVWFDTPMRAERAGFSLAARAHPTLDDPADTGAGSSADVDIDLTRSSLASSPAEEPADRHPYGDGSHHPFADRSMPAGYPIKGNVDSMLYHRPDSRNYGATIAEVWFDTPMRAERAGFSLAARSHPSDRPYGEGSRAPLPDDAMPDGFPIKGNLDSGLYHRPDSRSYGPTIAEVWFDTPERAEAAGFIKARTHPES
ncbi:MAG: hypothetical protein KDB21_06750 [Acidimicrobiales bacterium]|nr:hypothetical protein [Acidimicrobiales bacterium]